MNPGKARVVHRYREKCDIYIGRPSVWGNPFIMSKGASRAKVIEAYENWLRGTAHTNLFQRRRKEILARLPELVDKTLGCYCAPLPCHGDILLQLLKEL